MERGDKATDKAATLGFRILRNKTVAAAAILPWQEEADLRTVVEARVTAWHRTENQGEGLREYALALLVDLCDHPPPESAQHTIILGLWLARMADTDGSVFGRQPAGIELHLIGPVERGHGQKMVVWVASRDEAPTACATAPEG